MRRGFCRADRIYQADAAGDVRRWPGERGLDLPLQLAGRASAADRLGAVSGAVGAESAACENASVTSHCHARALCRASTSSFALFAKDVDGRDKPGHDEENEIAPPCE